MQSTEIEMRLSTAEGRLIEVLGPENSTQRSLARAAGMSVGMTNLLIKRLVKKGLIKVVSMNGRTLSYILTPGGFAEKLRRSYEYITLSIRNLQQVRDRIQALVRENPQARKIVVVGSGELAQLAKQTLREMGQDFSEVSGFEEIAPGDVLCLLCSPDFPREVAEGWIVQAVLV